MCLRLCGYVCELGSPGPSHTLIQCTTSEGQAKGIVHAYVRNGMGSVAAVFVMALHSDEVRRCGKRIVAVLHYFLVTHNFFMTKLCKACCSSQEFFQSKKELRLPLFLRTHYLLN